MPPRTTPAVDAPVARVCPQCSGTTWKTIDLTLERTDARDTGFSQQALDKELAKRGALLKCASCGYRTHANDDLTPATV